MDFKEIETKYYANAIPMDDFVKIVEPLNPEWIMVSSYDDYFTNENDEFIRYRYHDNMGELTIKRKTNNNNNLNRIEVNIKTESKSSKAVAAFVDLLGYKLNFSIFKTCKIAILDKVVLVYYIVYDSNLKELERFIEIEAREDIKWLNEKDAWLEIVKYEDILEPLGISAKKRLKKSLFEIFKC